MNTVSKATAEDLKSLVQLSVEFLTEASILHNAPVDLETLVETLLQSIHNPSWWAGLGRVDDQIAGMVIARRVDLFFSKCNVAVDCVFFIRKAYRGGLLIKRLVHGYSDWAFGDANCVGAQLNAFAGEDNERGARLAEALGFPRVGFIHYKKRK